MRKIFLGTFLGDIKIYAEGEINEKDEKLLHSEFKEAFKPRVKVDHELAKFCGIKTATYAEVDDKGEIVKL